MSSSLVGLLPLSIFLDESFVFQGGFRFLSSSPVVAVARPGHRVVKVRSLLFLSRTQVVGDSESAMAPGGPERPNSRHLHRVLPPGLETLVNLGTPKEG